MIKSKLKSVFALISFCCVFAFASSPKNISDNSGEVWIGITYIMAENGASNEATAGVAAIGLIDAAAWGAGVGMVAGPAGGVAAGIISGL